MAPTRYTIREVDVTNPKVKNDLLCLQERCLPGDETIKELHGWWWIVYHNGFPVGFANLALSASWAETGVLNRAGITKAHRGKGLQKRLIKVREDMAVKQGMKWLMSYCHVENCASANSLIKSGFTLYRPAAGEDLQWLCWRKKI